MLFSSFDDGVAWGGGAAGGCAGCGPDGGVMGELCFAECGCEGGGSTLL